MSKLKTREEVVEVLNLSIGKIDKMMKLNQINIIK